MKENGEIKSWNDLENEFKIEQRLYFKWMQLVNATPSNWKNNLKHSDTDSQNLTVLDHHLVKFNSLFSIEKLDSRELYCIVNSSHINKPTWQMYFEKKFDSKELDCQLYSITKSYHKHVFKIVSI